MIRENGNPLENLTCLLPLPACIRCEGALRGSVAPLSQRLAVWIVFRDSAMKVEFCHEGGNL